jgi:hypothetical protein
MLASAEALTLVSVPSTGRGYESRIISVSLEKLVNEEALRVYRQMLCLA